ncbi:hypothetical protein IWX90DRAFT_418794 [Phyllosticta citrichinensis]|uniref:LPXTG-motif cell wall anchor domain protein n=1 Tax=Phyllosticta citrichinensis TaxID=1130410 RepID=A0ABR1XGF0_9PEZI
MDDAHAKPERPQPPARSSSLRRLLRATSSSSRSSPSPSPASPRSSLSSPQPRLDPRTPPSGFASLQDLPRRLLNQGNSASRHRFSQEHRQPTPSTLRNSSPLTQSSTPSSTRPSRLTVPPSSSSRNSPADATPPSRRSLLSPGPRRPHTSLGANGIATSNGPPAALLTRRKSNNVLRVSHLSPRVPSASAVISPDTPTFTSSYQNYKLARKASQAALAQPPDKPTPLSSRVKSLPVSRATSPLPHVKRRRSISGLMDSDNQSDYDFACSHNGQPEQSKAGSGAEKPSNSEDLFLNIAQDSPQQDGDDDTVKLERRKSRIARLTRQSLPVNSLDRSATESDANTPTLEARMQSHYRRVSQLPSPSYRAPLSAREPPSGVTASFPADNSRVRSFGLSGRSREEEALQGRRSSIGDGIRSGSTASNNKYRYSSIGYTQRQTQPSASLESSPEITSRQERPEKQATNDGSDSLESTTAVSTIWDELDDLKSRIKKMELTGRIPPSSGAAMMNGVESVSRPRTATTQATSVILSPKQAKRSAAGASPPETTVSGAVAGAAAASHPLLHSALAKCKDQIGPALYRVLENTATEALELAAMTGNAGQSSAVSVASGVQSSDRQLRRKADNMCRNLTDLCIAICDSTQSVKSPPLKSPAMVVSSRRRSLHINGDRDEKEYHQPISRAGSAEPDGEMARNSPSRALHRIEARRASTLLGNQTGSAGNSPREGTDRDRTTPTQQSGKYQPRSGSSLLRPRRATVTNDDAPNQEEETSNLRVPSRASTDFVQRNTNNRNRLSREYTSNVPLPDGASSVAQLHTSASLRRSGTVATEQPGVQQPSSSGLLFRDRGERKYTPPSNEAPRYTDGYGSDERRQRLGLYSSSTPRTPTASSLPFGGRSLSLSRRLRQDT